MDADEVEKALKKANAGLAKGGANGKAAAEFGARRVLYSYPDNAEAKKILDKLGVKFSK